ncbi:acetyl-CoA carboxylase biotin carboxyl carrier protein [Balnearium lithotrophicum]|uniref:Biotin carboxyl carrier protein of acetyl-CoA carboxylase n=1 Tax=Balnearium lithotrophicum TaxID=223788 RepID=A0A521BVG7_9BACT|nr:acetyl-CoA carboxylase biotin carboxyl carrier protein [Balnearium lithotrophicum]SMO51168.1 acetyl-CoA carboxylase biotin carboxyl carrier protein [Balnearium lithotrophicum]
MENLEKVKNLLKSLENTSLEEVEIETEGIKIKAKFKREITVQTVKPSPVKEEVEVPQEEELEENYYVVESPMVGTFYRAPSPGAEPFVKEGDYVEKGQVLCIIEALKVMNEIESEVSGIVKKVLVENGQPVEYGQPLFYIEKK